MNEQAVTAVVQQIMDQAETQADQNHEILAVMRDDPQVGGLLRAAEAFALQRQAAEILDAADQAAHVAQLQGAVDDAVRAVEAGAEAVALIEDQVVSLVAEERAAEDDWRAAVDHHRTVAEAEAAASRNHVSPQEQTARLLELRAAADVVEREKASAEGARAVRVSGEAQLEQARGILAELKARHMDAVAAWEEPGRAPMGVMTLTLDGLRRLAAGVEMTGQEQAQLYDVVKDLAARLGVLADVRRDERRRIEDEAATRTAGRMLPAAGHPLRPASAVLPAPR